MALHHGTSALSTRRTSASIRVTATGAAQNTPLILHVPFPFFSFVKYFDDLVLNTFARTSSASVGASGPS
jgi:hypothetical protein